MKSPKNFIILLVLLNWNFALSAQEIYKSESLIINQLSGRVFVHTTFLNTESFGKVPCNGLIFKNGQEVIVLDTPADDSTSLELIQWIENELGAKIKTIVPTHFHEDCLGGLKAFHDRNISSLAHTMTIALAQKQGSTLPQKGFQKKYTFKLGNQKVLLEYFGEGHTRDNIIAYIPSEKAIFGGCLIKEVKAGKGYLGDAHVAAWSPTVSKIKRKYPDLKIVVPGHGKWGGVELLDYTIELFKNQ